MDPISSERGLAIDPAMLSFLPPPWKPHPKGGFVNEVTGELSTVHPLLRLQSTKCESDVDEGEYQNNRSPTDVIERVETCAESNAKLRSLHESYTEYHCSWQERNLFGNSMVFGLTIHFFESDRSCIIKFDDVDAEWRYSVLKCKYGIVDRYDLFIGAQIVVFGRHLSITSTNGSTCEWIEKEGKKLKQRIEYLQSKLESIGAVPCVCRLPPANSRHIGRSISKPGSVNLRKLHNEILRLQDQLVDLGASHFTLK